MDLRALRGDALVRMMDFIDELRQVIEASRDAPPVAREIRASHAVPWGRTYRQWNVFGELLLWVNRGELAEILAPAREYREIGLGFADGLLGIPLVFE